MIFNQYLKNTILKLSLREHYTELVLGRRKRLLMAHFIFPRTQEVFAKVTNTFFYQV